MPNEARLLLAIISNTVARTREAPKRPCGSLPPFERAKSDSSGKVRVRVTLININCHVMGRKGLAPTHCSPPTFCGLIGAKGYYFGTLSLSISRSFSLWGKGGTQRAQGHVQSAGRKKKKRRKRKLKREDDRKFGSEAWILGNHACIRARPHEQMSSQLERRRRGLPNRLVARKFRN